MEENSSFANVLAVVEFLKAGGWKIKKSSVYLHVKQRKLRAQKDGTFERKAVEKYARSYLKRLDPASVASPGLDHLQQKRIEAETRKMEAQAEHWGIKAKVEAGTFIERTAFERALAQRAVLLKSDLDVFARTKAPAIVHLVDGDLAKVPDLIEYMLHEVDNFLARYSEDRKFTVPGKPASLSVNDGEDEDGDNEINESGAEETPIDKKDV